MLHPSSTPASNKPSRRSSPRRATTTPCDPAPTTTSTASRSSTATDTSAPGSCPSRCTTTTSATLVAHCSFSLGFIGTVLALRLRLEPILRNGPHRVDESFISIFQTIWRNTPSRVDRKENLINHAKDLINAAQFRAIFKVEVRAEHGHLVDLFRVERGAEHHLVFHTVDESACFDRVCGRASWTM